MPQNVGDLLHRRSGTKKSAGHAVPENVELRSASIHIFDNRP